MAKRLSILLVALLALGFVVAGCGDDDDDEAKNDTQTVTTTTEDKSPDTGGSAASGVPSTPQAKQAIARCKRQADAQPQLSDKAKSKIGEVCEEAGSGDADGAVKATKEACRIIVDDTAPAGTAKQTALKACDQATATP